MDETPKLVEGLPEQPEKGTLQKLKHWMSRLVEEKVETFRSQSMSSKELTEYQNMMQMMIEKARLEEPTRATGGSGSSGGDFIKAKRWNRQ